MNNVYIPKGLKKDAQAGMMYDASDIIKLVREYFGISWDELIDKSRKTEVVYPRQVCQYLLFKYTRHSAKGIAVMFSQVDKTSCANSVKVIDAYLIQDMEVKKQIDELEKKIKNA